MGQSNEAQMGCGAGGLIREAINPDLRFLASDPGARRIRPALARPPAWLAAKMRTCLDQCQEYSEVIAVVTDKTPISRAYSAFSAR